MNRIYFGAILIGLNIFTWIDGLYTQPSSCGPIVNTGVNHTIILANFSPTLDSMPLPAGSYIIVQYEVAGNLVCGGYTQWNGANTSISAYGDDPNTPTKDGFATNELFKYKLELPDGKVLDSSRIEVGYATGGIFSNTNLFQANGISGLNQFDAASYDLISVSNISIDTLCREYQVQFQLAGGTGTYVVDSLILDSSIFISNSLPCGSQYFFLVSDDQNTMVLPVSGALPDCQDSLGISGIAINIDGNEYTVQYDIQGGMGIYQVNSEFITGSNYESQPIACGTPYEFTITDGCDTLFINDLSPCTLCPTSVGDFSETINLCDGSIPVLPSDSIILASVDFPDSAIISWSADPLLPFVYSGDGCMADTFEFYLTVQCSRDTDIQLPGGVIRFLIYPQPQAPQVVFDTVLQNLCIYQVIPNCPTDIVTPDTLDGFPNNSTGLVQAFSVANSGCPVALFENVPIPDCIFEAVSNQLGSKRLNIIIYGNPVSRDNDASLQVSLPKSSDCNISLFDINGTQVYNSKVFLSRGNHSLQMQSVTGPIVAIPAGIYFLEVKTEYGSVVKKLVKF